MPDIYSKICFTMFWLILRFIKVQENFVKFVKLLKFEFLPNKLSKHAKINLTSIKVKSGKLENFDVILPHFSKSFNINYQKFTIFDVKMKLKQL